MTTYTLDKKLLARFLKNVQQEILNIQSGEPKWRTGPPLHFETNKAVPVLAVLERFQQAPTKANYDAFIAQATQDLGKPTGDGFATWGQSLFIEVSTKGTPVAASKTFAAAIKDGFYDCFRVARISMDQKQVDRMEKATDRMANVFQAEISKAVGDQLDALVARLKKAEEKRDAAIRRAAAEEEVAKADAREEERTKAALAEDSND